MRHFVLVKGPNKYLCMPLSCLALPKLQQTVHLGKKIPGCLKLAALDWPPLQKQCHEYLLNSPAKKWGKESEIKLTQNSTDSTHSHGTLPSLKTILSLLLLVLTSSKEVSFTLTMLYFLLLNYILQ